MLELTTIGANDPSIKFIDRPTVKVIVTRGEEILILNDGLLPGGGIDAGEDFAAAIARELQEELGARVKNIQEIGCVTQYRTFLQKRYLVYGFTAELVSFDFMTNPQDEGEKNFILNWMDPADVISLINSSVQELQMKHPIHEDDSTQGKLYNLITSLELVKLIQ